MINRNNSDLEIVSEFLIRFYHQEPDYLNATIRALKVLRTRHQYKWELSKAFRNIFKSSLSTGTLKDLILLSANRYVQNDEEAKEVLQKIYDDNILETAVNFNELTE